MADPSKRRIRSSRCAPEVVDEVSIDEEIVKRSAAALGIGLMGEE
jgi:hypothetical protein